MPTLGFVLDTVEDRFYERGGETTQPEMALPMCPVCGTEVAGQHELVVHLGSAHPLAAPRLLIGGHVVVSRRVLQRHLAPGALEVVNADRIMVSRDGGPRQAWTNEELREVMSTALNAVLDVHLENRRADGNAAAVETVRITLNVPPIEQLDRVDEVFQEILAVETLDEYVLDRFVDAAQGLRGAERYASALHDYGVAILVKDRAVGTADALTFDSHRGKLQKALHVLREFPDRTIARAICGFARFGLNDFAVGRPTSGVPSLDRCVGAVQGLLGHDDHAVVSDTEPTGGRCPVDRTTAFILERWDDPRRMADLAVCATDMATTADDAVKCRVLAARWDRPGPPSVPELLRPLVNDLTFGPWVSEMLHNGA